MSKQVYSEFYMRGGKTARAAQFKLVSNATIYTEEDWKRPILFFTPSLRTQISVRESFAVSLIRSQYQM